MPDNSVQKQIEKLGKDLARQKAIFDRYAPKVINPSNDPAYLAAKKKFDAAYRRMGEIEKELERLKNPSGTQTQPSQTKVKIHPD